MKLRAMNYWLSLSRDAFLSRPKADHGMCDVAESDYEELAIQTEPEEPQTVAVPLQVSFVRKRQYPRAFAVR